MRIVPRVDEEDGTRLTGNFEKKKKVEMEEDRSMNFQPGLKNYRWTCLNLLNLFRKNGKG